MVTVYLTWYTIMTPNLKLPACIENLDFPTHVKPRAQKSEGKVMLTVFGGGKCVLFCVICLLTTQLLGSTVHISDLYNGSESNQEPCVREPNKCFGPSLRIWSEWSRTKYMFQTYIADLNKSRSSVVMNQMPISDLHYGYISIPEPCV